MTVYIFCGPTLSPAEVAAEIDAVCLPPVAQGDVYRLAQRRPRAIGIIDGYFERVPAVWHKEILWAMAEGVRVYGSASMGALRAAELAAFGMIGVGWVFDQFSSGALEDDDEVAVAHGPAEAGYAPQSEALVNIRQTLAAAVAAGVIGGVTSAALAALAKGLFYPERTYPRLLALGDQPGLPAAELAALRGWLPRGQVNQKQADARAMLRLIRHDLTLNQPPPRVSYHFEHTTWWDRAQRFGSIDTVATHGDGSAEALQLDALLDELRLEGRAYGRAHDHAALRLLTLREARRRGLAATPELVEQTASAWRRGRGLADSAQFENWLARNGLDRAAFERLMREEALVLRARGALAPEVTHRLLDDLLVAGAFGDLLARARAKQQLLAARGLLNPSLAEAGIGRAELLHAHFAQRGRAVPADLARHAANAGFADEAAFIIALLREWCYARALNDASSG